MCRDNRELEGKICTFDSHGADSEYEEYDGELCVVKKRVEEERYDFNEVGTIWEIEFKGKHDGSEAEAFTDELKEVQLIFT